MIVGIAHIGITVSNIEKSKHFYQNVLGLTYRGEMTMEGDSADKLFGLADCEVKVAYFSIDFDPTSKTLVELIEFVNPTPLGSKSQLNRLSISELCFRVENIDRFTKDLKMMGVDFLSSPQYFDLNAEGGGKSKAVYLRDPDGNILEFLEDINE